MKKRTITITFESDAPEGAIHVLAEDMCAQLESLCDGTMDLGTQHTPDIIDEPYNNASVKVT